MRFRITSLAFLVCCPTFVFAEPRDEDFSLRFNLGGMMPRSHVTVHGTGGGDDTAGDISLVGGGQVLYTLSPRWRAGVDFSITPEFSAESTQWVRNTTTFFNEDFLSIQPVMQYVFIPEGKYRPYGLVGVGLYRSRLKLTSKPLSGLTWGDTSTIETRTLIDDHGINFTSLVGVGLDIFVTKDIFWGVECRWQYVGPANYEATATGRSLGLTDARSYVNQYQFMLQGGFRLSLFQINL